MEQEKKGKKKGCLVAFLIVAVTMAACMGIIATVGTAVETGETDTTQGQTGETTKKEEERSIYKDATIEASYIGIAEYSGVGGTAYLQLRIKNVGKQKIILSLSDVSVNGVTTQSGTAVPTELEPGKTTKTPFIIFTKNTDISSVKDIENLDFKIRVSDSNYNEIETTKTLSLKLK